MSNCKFTLKDKDGNVIVDGVSEQSFKKYLAQEGLSEYINSGEIKINMDFLKEFIVTPKEKTTKKYSKNLGQFQDLWLNKRWYVIDIPKQPFKKYIKIAIIHQ
jgi:hypothetical protein